MDEVVDLGFVRAERLLPTGVKRSTQAEIDEAVAKWMREDEERAAVDLKLAGYEAVLRQIADSGNSINAHLARTALGDG